MKIRYTAILICLALLIGLALPTTAAEKRRVDVKPKSTSQSAEHRIALVIGNANYRTIDTLKGRYFNQVYTDAKG